MSDEGRLFSKLIVAHLTYETFLSNVKEKVLIVSRLLRKLFSAYFTYMWFHTCMYEKISFEGFLLLFFCIYVDEILLIILVNKQLFTYKSFIFCVDEELLTEQIIS